MDSRNSSLFECFCDKYYKGEYCESKIDICQNETCSGNGKCNDVNNEAKCECFNLYLGDKCQTKSNELKAIQAFISTASIIAILTVVLFYACIILMDLERICTRDKNKNRIKRNILVKKFIYFN